MISSSDFRNGTMFEMDGQLLEVVSVEHIKLARAGAVIKAKLRNLLTGSIFDQSFRSGDKYRTVRIDKAEATYLYSDGSHHYFMDTRTYDQVPVDEDVLESVLPLLKEGSPAYLLTYQGKLRHGFRRHEAGQARNGRCDPGAAVHPDGRFDPSRHAKPDLHGARLSKQGNGARR